MDELLDLLYYIQDIFALNMDQMNRILTFHLIQYLVAPMLVGNLTLVSPSGSERRHPAPPVELKPRLVLYLLAQFFHIFTHAPFINAAGALLLHPTPTLYDMHHKLPAAFQTFNQIPDFVHWKSKECEAVVPPRAETPNSQRPRTRSGLDSMYSSMRKPATPPRPPPQASIEPTPAQVRGRDALLDYLRSDEDQLVLGSLCVLYSMSKNHTFERKLLGEAGLLPHRLVKVQNLLDSLILESPRSKTSTDLFGESTGPLDLFADPSQPQVSFIKPENESSNWSSGRGNPGPVRRISDKRTHLCSFATPKVSRCHTRIDYYDAP
jgi:hypothetical protein